MEFGLVRAADEIAHRLDRAVGDHTYFGAVESHRTQETGWTVEGRANLGFISQPEISHAFQLAEFDFVQHVIAAQQQDDHLFSYHHRDELDGAGKRNIEQGGDVFAGGLFRRVHFAQGFLRDGARCGGRQRLGQFDVGRVIGLRTVGDQVFAGIGQHVEFMRAGAADGAGVGRHCAEG